MEEIKRNEKYFCMTVQGRFREEYPSSLSPFTPSLSSLGNFQYKENVRNRCVCQCVSPGNSKLPPSRLEEILFFFSLICQTIIMSVCLFAYNSVSSIGGTVYWSFLVSSKNIVFRNSFLFVFAPHCLLTKLLLIEFRKLIKIKV